MESLLNRRESITVIGEQLIVVPIKRVAQQVAEGQFEEGFLPHHFGSLELLGIAVGIGRAIVEHRTIEFRMVCARVLHMDIIHAHRDDFSVFIWNLRNDFFFLFARHHGYQSTYEYN